MSEPTSTRTPGTPRKEGAGFVVSFGAERTCDSDGCTTRLSRYNQSPSCWVHDGGRRRG